MKVVVGFSLLFAGICVGNCMGWKEASIADSVVDLRLLDEKTGEVISRGLTDLLVEHERDSKMYDRAPSVFSRDNPQQETQLLFGERVQVEPFLPDWYRVQALEQKIFKDGAWQSTQGFIRSHSVAEFPVEQKKHLTIAVPWTMLYQYPDKKSHVLKNLSCGTCLPCVRREGDWWIVDTPVGPAAVRAQDVLAADEVDGFSVDQLRNSIVETAKLFLNGPYIWGGCSAWKEHAENRSDELDNQITGVDCSGLMYLVFKTHGLLIPRNSHDQFLMSDVIGSGDLLSPGDLIFFANPQKKPPRVNHVMMYIGKDVQGRDLILEAQGGLAPYGVRIIPTCEYARLEKKTLRELVHGQCTRWIVDGTEMSNIVYFGTFLTAEKRLALRRAFFDAK